MLTEIFILPDSVSALISALTVFSEIPVPAFQIPAKPSAAHTAAYRPRRGSDQRGSFPGG